MREIGGYIELDTYTRPMLHDKAIPLNCGRNCLAYLIKANNIKKIRIPCYICQSIPSICKRMGVEISYYHIGIDFKPSDKIELEQGEWFYLINYYSQISNNEIENYVKKYKRIIVDNANSYFQKPFKNIDTIYTCRKYFGVADGAFLYSNSTINDDLPIDESYLRMNFLLGRYERSAGEFYQEYNENNKAFEKEPIKRMSKLTMNLLHGIDYNAVKKRRIENFEYLHNKLGEANILKLKSGTFMYPFMIDNGMTVRKKLQLDRIYIPLLWPNVFDTLNQYELEYTMAQNILPLPIDQRYNLDDMEYMTNKIMQVL